MKPYPEYKETGLSWLPKIPKHWEVVRAKNLYRRVVRAVGPNDDVVTCFRDGVVTLRKNRRTTGFTESLQEIGYQGIRKGDLVIHAMDAFAGAVGVSDSDGKGTPVYSVCVAKDGFSVNNYFYAYVVREMAKTGFIQSLYRGIRERSSDFRFEVFGNQEIPLPPVNEQEKIVRYLDLMTAKIDTLIDAKKKQIALKIERLNSYLFSEKGATHLGWWETCFPSHWNLEKARRIFVERNQKGYSDRELLAVTQDQGILYKKDCPQHFVEPGDPKTQKLVCTGDCVISLRSFQGGIETSDFEGLVSAAYSVFYIKKTDLLLSNYYRYLFKTPAFIAYLNTLVRDIRDGKKIGFDDFRECFLPIPPAAHLEKIKGFVDEIEILKKSLHNEQKLLREYKDSLISSIVTGGLEVLALKSF